VEKMLIIGPTTTNKKKIIVIASNPFL
jgi:hypothetical protein